MAQQREKANVRKKAVYESEPYTFYLKSHTHINNYIKIATIAVDYLYNSKEDKKALSELINQLILQSGERWTPRIIQNPKSELKTLTNDLSKSAIMWVYSAFDAYFKKIEGVLSSKFKKNDEQQDGDTSDSVESTHRIKELYLKLNWDTEEINDLIIIAQFYESIRHSIVHNFGDVSGDIQEIANSTNFKIALSNWKTKFPKKAISPPPIINKTEMELRPHHPILYSETCRRLAIDIDKKTFQMLGLSSFTEKIVKDHLTNTSKLTSPECLNLARYIIYHLRKDFNIEIDINTKLDDLLKKDEIEKHKKRYNTLKEK